MSEPRDNDVRQNGAPGAEESAELVRLRDALLEETSHWVVGQSRVLKLLAAGLFSQGHCLLVGVPGLAKTLMVRAMAAAMDLRFRRIQFTPDLMPADITGSEMLDETAGVKRFRFVQGPLFAHVVLADEINRTPPKTQAALLEAMQERQVTVGQETFPLPEPFFVIATQNPIEQEGTYDLPEAQLDRFLFHIKVGYPNLEEEERILERMTGRKLPKIKPALSVRSILQAQKTVRSVHASRAVIRYVVRLIRASRPQDPMAPDYAREYVEWGAGPRGGHALLLAAKAWAAIDGRPAVAPEDVREVAHPVLRHRIGVNFTGRADEVRSDDIIDKLLEDITLE